MKRSTKMSKVFDAYASRKGVARGSIRFLFDGERITDDDTPESVSGVGALARLFGPFPVTPTLCPTRPSLCAPLLLLTCPAARPGGPRSNRLRDTASRRCAAMNVAASKKMYPSVLLFHTNYTPTHALNSRRVYAPHC